MFEITEESETLVRIKRGAEINGKPDR